MSLNKSQEIVSLYLNGMSIPEVSETVCKAKSTVRYHLKKAGVLRTRAQGIRLAEKSGKIPHGANKGRKFDRSWKENIAAGRAAWAMKCAKGTYINGQGYQEYTRGEHKGRSVHIVAMEARIGRMLLEDECVHHVDGNKLNNNENNLALLTKSGHMRLHRFEETLSGITREREENGRFC